jgi:tetratricopeptide (TPR) repeat protein
VSGNPGRSRLGQVARLAREAEAAAAAGRLSEAVARLKEAVRLDPRDRRTLHRLGDIHRLNLHRLAEAAGFYAKEARCEEAEGFHARAIALWRLVLRCDPARLESHERIGALYVALGRTADARAHYEGSAAALGARGLAREAALLRAQQAVLAPAGAVPLAPLEAAAPPADEPGPDDTAVDLAADHLQNGRLYHHYGLHRQAREQLELLVASLPEHVEGRQLLVEVCRALGDPDAAAQHLRVVTRVLRKEGQAGAPSADSSTGAAWELPPVEAWVLEETPPDPVATLLEELRDDVGRAVDHLQRKGGTR